MQMERELYPYEVERLPGDVHGRRREEAPTNGIEPRTRISLQPVAAPSILGLFSFGAAAFVIGAHLAHWYGDAASAQYNFAFVAFVGGLAQLLAGMWAFKARDGVATAFHGLWGAFWLAYGLLAALFTLGTLTAPVRTFPEYGFWFIWMGAATFGMAAAAIAVNAGLFVTLLGLGIASGMMAAGEISGIGFWTVAAGWCFVWAAVAGWYTAVALLLHDSFGHSVLPVGRTGPKRRAAPFAIGLGEPGVIHGQ
jgi:succinate-acetate transporter protein